MAKIVNKIDSYLEEAEKFEFSPEGKAPTGVKKDKVIPSISGQAKEAITKIWNRTEEFRGIKDAQLEKQSELTALKNDLAEEKAKIAVELDGYLQMASNAFDKMGLVINKAYAFKTDEKEVLVTIQEKEVRIAKTSEKVKDKTPTQILETLLEMGKITEDVVEEAKKEIDKYNDAISTVIKMRNLFSFPKASKDVTEGFVEHMTLKVKKMWNSVKSAFNSLKKFGKFAESKANEFEAAHERLKTLIRS